MYQVSKDIHFSYAHRLVNHPGKCKNLHGHNGRVTIEVEREQLDEQNMVVDFAKITKTIGKWIEETLDHKLILWREDPAFKLLKESEKGSLVEMDESPTAEVLAKWIFVEARAQGLPVTKVTLWETCESAASYFEK